MSDDDLDAFGRVRNRRLSVSSDESPKRRKTHRRSRSRSPRKVRSRSRSRSPRRQRFRPPHSERNGHSLHTVNHLGHHASQSSHSHAHPSNDSRHPARLAQISSVFPPKPNLLSYKQYIEMHPNSDLKSYIEYKSNVLKSASGRASFEKVKHEEFARQLYDLQTRNDYRKEQFSSMNYEHRFKEFLSSGSSSHQEEFLFIPTISTRISPLSIQQMFDNITGFRYLAFKHPPIYQLNNWSRQAIISLSDEKSAVDALNKLNGVNLEQGLQLRLRRLDRGPLISVMQQKAPTSENLQREFEQALSLLKHLNSERLILDQTSDEFDQKIANLSSVQEKFDCVISCLRQVHHTCFLCPLHYDKFHSFDDLLTWCGSSHFRTNDSISNYFNELDDSLHKRLSLNSSQFDNLPHLETSESAHSTLIEQYYDQQIIKRDESKFECSLCGKLFRGREFVVKHIHNKHLSEFQTIDERIKKRSREEAMFINYSNDPLAPSDLEKPLHHSSANMSDIFHDRTKLKRRSHSPDHYHHHNSNNHMRRINPFMRSQQVSQFLNSQMIVPFAQMMPQMAMMMSAAAANANMTANTTTKANPNTNIPQRILRNYNDVDATSIVQIVPDYELLFKPHIDSTNKSNSNNQTSTDQTMADVPSIDGNMSNSAPKGKWQKRIATKIKSNATSSSTIDTVNDSQSQTKTGKSISEPVDVFGD